MLWFLLMVGHDHLAEQVSIFYLVIGSIMVIFNNEAHFDFYKMLFDGDSSNANMSFRKKSYYERLVYHGIIFSAVVFLLTFIIVGDIGYSILFFFILILEKIFDEIQRILQFQKKFKSWGILFIIKSLAPFISCLGVYAAIKTESYVGYAFFGVTALTNLLLIAYMVEKRDWRLIFGILSKVGPKRLKNYVTIYLEKLFLNQLQSFSTRNVPLMDRLLVRFIMPGFLPQLSIVSQIGSISIMFVDYFLIAHRRGDYLVKSKRVLQIVSLRTLIGFMVVSFLLYSFAIFIGDYLGFLNQINIRMDYLVLLGIYYAFFAIGQHFVNYNFWNIRRKFTLLVDLGYYLISIFLFFLLNLTMEPIEAIIWSLLFSNALRLILSVILALKENKYGIDG